MGIIPKGRTKRITWYIAHAARWAEDPVGIGSSIEQVAALEAAVEEARLARIEQERAQSVALTATARLQSAIKTMSRLGSCVMMQIRIKAGVNDPSVYGKAWVPKPRKKSRMGEPGKPRGFTFTLEQIGWVTLRWKCNNPKNAVSTLYHVHRQLNGSGAFVYLGAVGKKKFVDETLPAGTVSVTYQVQAMRSTGRGPLARFYISLGSQFRRPLANRLAA